ncbi:MAG: NAD(P)-dependent alcohol dehydrogenase [Desulfuromonadaceae bacterium]|nr:NAD(P)-dependent alcohol dehydrogenase [Desulfuromonadaceae bacterium]
MTLIKAWAAHGPKEKLVPYEFDPGRLNAGEIEVKVEYCGLCHSDLSVLNNDWGNSEYPLVPGHEVIGRIVALGSEAKGLQVGQLVGVGWFSGSCRHCKQCVSGEDHLCSEAASTIIGHAGGFADRVRTQWNWAIPIPEGLDPRDTGPLMCAGTTVFSPFLIHDIKPGDRIGVVGIGGLGHLGIKFAKAWGCEVTAFTSRMSKYDEAKKLGADHVVSSTDSSAIGTLAGIFDMLLVTVNVALDWAELINALAPKGTLHIVGAVDEPIPVAAFQLIESQRTIAGSPTGSPATIARMLDFAARYKISPQVEHFPMSRVNEAFAYLESGKARYRIVLDADFS